MDVLNIFGIRYTTNLDIYLSNTTTYSKDKDQIQIQNQNHIYPLFVR